MTRWEGYVSLSFAFNSHVERSRMGTERCA